MLKEITNMLKKDVEVRWTTTTREYFSRIKEAFQEAPMLVSPDYQKPFQIIFSLFFPFYSGNNASTDKLGEHRATCRIF